MDLHAPVAALTCAASLNFSSMEVAAAAWMNFPNRVPVLAKPQDGISTFKASRTCPIFSTDLSFMAKPPFEEHDIHARVKMLLALCRHSIPHEYLRPAHHGVRRGANHSRATAVEHRELHGEIAEG